MNFRIICNRQLYPHLNPFSHQQKAGHLPEIIISPHQHRLLENARPYELTFKPQGHFQLASVSNLDPAFYDERIAFIQGGEQKSCVSLLPQCEGLRYFIGSEHTEMPEPLKFGIWTHLKTGTNIMLQSLNGEPIFEFCADITQNTSQNTRDWRDHGADFHPTNSQDGVGPIPTSYKDEEDYSMPAHRGLQYSGDIVSMAKGVLVRVNENGSISDFSIQPAINEKQSALILGRRAIGNHDSDGIYLTTESASRAHAVLIMGGFLVLEDLGSRNGTFLWGERITHRQIHYGDLINIGTALVKFLDPSEEGEREVTSIRSVPIPEFTTSLGKIPK